MKRAFYAACIVILGLLCRGRIYSQSLEPPTLKSPSNNATLSANQVRLSWDAAADADDYLVQVATDPNFINLVVPDGDSGGELYYDVNLDDGTYYWAVASYSSTYDIYSEPSPAFSFTIFTGPVISSYSGSLPAGWNNSSVTISGSRFGAAKGTVTFPVNLAQNPPQTVDADVTTMSWSDGQITCLIPMNASSGLVIITTAQGKRNSSGPSYDVTWGYGGGKWTNSPPNIPVSIFAPGAYQGTKSKKDLEDIITAAATTWCSPNTGARFNFVPNTDGGDHQIGFVHGTSLHDATRHAETQVGITGGSITGIITEINVGYNLDTQYDLQSTATHEFGHWLSLTDLYGDDDWSKMMYGNYAGVRHSLTKPEIDGIQAIYGSGSLVEVGDQLVIDPGWNVVVPNSNPSYTFHLVDTGRPNHLVGNVSWDFVALYAGGEYKILSGSSPAGLSFFEFDFGTLPDGCSWIRDGSGNVEARLDISGTEDDATPLSGSYHVSISGIPANNRTSSGSLSHNETWGGINNNAGSIIVPPGVTLTILPGTVVNFPPNASLTVSGVLLASGSQLLPITFAPTTGLSPGSWGSIIFSGPSASGSIISYANILHGTEVDVANANNITFQNSNIINNSGNGIYVNSSSNFLAQSNTIKNTSIYHGIYISGGSNNNCYWNTISKTNHSQNGAGILYAGSSGTAGENDIDYHNWGIAGIWGASPSADQYASVLNNRVTNCIVGLEIYYQSYGMFGLKTSWSAYALNSIYNNGYDAAVGLSYPTVFSQLYAEADWWGSNLTSYRGSACTLNVSSPLTADPWLGYQIPSNKRMPNDIEVTPSIAQDNGHNIQNGSVQNIALPSSIPSDSLLIAVQLRDQKKAKDAKKILKAYLSSHPADQAAYVYLYSCADSETTPEIIQFFKALPIQAAVDHKLLLSRLFLMEGDYSSAKQVNDGIISAYPNTARAVRADLNNLEIALYFENDVNKASAILKRVENQAQFSTPMEISTAEATLKFYVDPKTGQMPNINAGQGNDLIVSVSPITDGLLENYPNPFNPSTSIQYKIAESNHVTLKVYDVLGRVVATLVDGYIEDGNHSVTFDASRLSSGIYFYELRAGHFRSVKKMLLIK